MIRAPRFYFRPALTVAAAAAFALLVGLGQWQLHRLQWKNDLIALVEARLAAAPIPFDEARARFEAGADMRYAPVHLEGVFRHGDEAHVFGTYEGEAGYYVFTPLQPAAGGPAVYVNRGFVPQAKKDRSQRPDGLVQGRVKLAGLFREPETPRGVAAFFRPDDRPDANEWHRRSPAAFAAHAGLEAASAYVDADGATGPGEWPKGGTTRLAFNNRHLEYALTWFGLAATLLGVYLFLSLQPPRR